MYNVTVSEIVIFHSILGLRPSVRTLGARLSESGHRVHIPDLYLGEGPFDTYSAAAAHQKTVGFKELLARATTAVETLPTDLFYAGFSAGCAPAQILGAQRAGARGVVLMHGGSALPTLRIGSWPSEVPVQVHCAERDPFCDRDQLAELVTAVRSDGAAAEWFEYPLSSHLFTDAELPDEYDEPFATLVTERVAKFVAEGRRGRAVL
jgi:dienelactone hydrolase